MSTPTSKEMDFGDYCLIEQKRYSVPNEMYVHKVIGRLESSAWVDVPVDAADGGCTERNHDEVVPVVAAICCGVSEREVRRYRVSDCIPRPTHETPAVDPFRVALERLASMESFTRPRSIKLPEDAELIARIEFAQLQLAGANELKALEPRCGKCGQDLTGKLAHQCPTVSEGETP
jgi:hypothetical protein